MSLAGKSGVLFVFILLLFSACGGGNVAKSRPTSTVGLAGLTATPTLESGPPLGQPLPPPPVALVAASAFRVVGLDAISGALLWQFTGATFVKGVTQRDHRVFFTGENSVNRSSEVIAMDARDGQILWRTGFDGAFPSDLALSDSIVFVANQKSLLALKMTDGTILWQLPLSASQQVEHLITDSNQLYVAFADRLAAFGATKGNLVWQDQGSFVAPILTHGIILANAACNGSTIIIIGTYGICTSALDTTSGKVLWGVHIAGGTCVLLFFCTGSQGGPSVTNGSAAYVISKESTSSSGMATPTTSVHQDLVALHLAGGAEWWRVDLPGSDGLSTDTLPDFTVLGANERIVIVGASNGKVSAFTIGQTKQIWQTNLLLSSVFSFQLFQGIAYFLGDSEVIAINPTNGVTLWTETYSPV